jgi:hypothetical protein
MNATELLSRYSKSNNTVTLNSVIQMEAESKTDWSQLAYTLFQDSSSFVNFDRFQGVADILTSTPWNKLPDEKSLISLASQFVPEIDEIQAAIRNGIDIYEDIRSGINNINDASENGSLIQKSLTYVAWADKLREQITNQL